MMLRMAYDTARLEELGRRFKELRAQLDEVRTELTPEIAAAFASGEFEQKTIADLSGYTRETVRVICLTPEQREAEKNRRRNRTRLSGE
jgi:hypothetical protein